MDDDGDQLVDTDILVEFDANSDTAFRTALEGILGKEITNDAYSEVKSLADDKVEVPE